jgi:hypothetical protein
MPQNSGFFVSKIQASIAGVFYLCEGENNQAKHRAIE